MTNLYANAAAKNVETGRAETQWWHVLDDGRGQCDVCPRQCRMPDGQRGLSFVGGAEAGRILRYFYGRSR